MPPFAASAAYDGGTRPGTRGWGPKPPSASRQTDTHAPLTKCSPMAKFEHVVPLLCHCRFLIPRGLGPCHYARRAWAVVLWARDAEAPVRKRAKRCAKLWSSVSTEGVPQLIPAAFCEEVGGGGRGGCAWRLGVQRRVAKAGTNGGKSGQEAVFW